MASYRKRGRVWYYRFTDADGIKRECRGCPDRRETEAMARQAESEAAKVRAGLSDPRDLAYQRHALSPLSAHLDAFEAFLSSKGDTAAHARLYSERARRLAALACGGRLAEFDPPKTATQDERARCRAIRDRTLSAGRLAHLTPTTVQGALATLRAAGRGLQTLNHHRAAVRSFILWARKDGRLRDDPLFGLSGYNAKEDRRHDRRTLALDDLRRLIVAAHDGPSYREMTGPARAICYRLAVASGLRYSEIASITPGSFAFGPEGATVTVKAGYAKNREEATLPLPADLAADLRPALAGMPSGVPVFPLPKGGGAAMLRGDLGRAGIPYKDASGRVYDFHSLRCQCATLADRAGVSPRIVQRLMRHSKLEMTDRYTRPRMHDIEGATAALPSLRPAGPAPEGMAATGTDGQHIGNRFAHHLPTGGDGNGRDVTGTDGITVSGPMASMDRNPPVLGELGASGRVLTGPVASDRGGARTHDQRINVPSAGRRKPEAPNRLRIAADPPAHHLPTDTRPTPPDLAAVVDAWPSLPEAIRAGILAMVRAASEGGGR